MNIEQKQTNGCDKLSRVYEEMFNVLQEVMQDEDKLKQLSSLDFSALGMYIGKFVEQEINSSVVQIMRAFRGVKMPDYYCKRYPRYIFPVETDRQSISLNSKKNLDDPSSLRTISLGDAFCALKVLKSEDHDSFFETYQWLNDTSFLDAWNELSKFRNKMAHIGEIIDADMLKENYEVFLVFLRFMPDITKAKKKLAPRGYKGELPTPQKKEEVPPLIKSTERRNNKPNATKAIAQQYNSLKELSHQDDDLYVCGSDILFEKNMFNRYSIPTGYIKRELSKITNKYNFDAIIFEEGIGKKGLIDCLGNILVPANYEGFGFIPKTMEMEHKSIIAARGGKYVLVALDGTGKELTKAIYDEIRLANNELNNSPYMFRKNGMHGWGIMNELGDVICDNIIDNYYCSKNSLIYESNELRGYWHFTKPTSPFLPPIFDDIEMTGNPNDPLLFTLNGIEGYVEIFEDDYEFIPLSNLNKLDEEDRNNTLECCVCEEF